MDQMAKERTPNAPRKAKTPPSAPSSGFSRSTNNAHSPSQAKRLASHEPNIEEEDSSMGPGGIFHKATDESTRMLEHSLYSNTNENDTLGSESTCNTSGLGTVAFAAPNKSKNNENAGQNQHAAHGDKKKQEPHHQQNKKNSSIISRPKTLNKSINSSVGSSSSSLNDPTRPPKSRLKTYLTRSMIKLNFFVLSPDDNTMFAWLIILNMCVLYNIWLIIARQSFEKLQIFYREYWIIADYVVDAIYALDILIQFRTGYLEQGLLVYNSKKLAINYSRSRNFLLDVFSLTPLEIIQWKLQFDLPILRFPRFFKCYRTIDFYYMTESRTLYPNVWRVANLTHILFLLGHWFAGFYFLISKAEGFKGAKFYSNLLFFQVFYTNCELK